MTICPCCGFRFEGDLRKGCEGCGARAVGEPLPKPQHELPAYGRSLLLVVTGTLMVLGFLAETVVALEQHVPFSFGFWSWIAAGETAAWRLKWISIPVTFVVLWGGRRVYRSMMQAPSRFVGLKVARRGLVASACVSVLIATLIGVTVPARLRQRRISIQAGLNAQAYTRIRALLEYQALYKTLPTDFKDLARLPDPDGSIAAALANTDPSWYHTSSTTIAEVPKEKPRLLAGAAIRSVSANSTTDDSPGVLSFDTYELRLPGEDKIINNEDDLIIKDGVILKASEVKEVPVPRAPLRAGKR